MLRLLSSNAQGRKDFWKPSKPCGVGIHWKALTENSQMITNMPWFKSFFGFFAPFCIVKLATSSIRVKALKGYQSQTQSTGTDGLTHLCLKQQKGVERHCDISRRAACNITTCPVASCKWIWLKTTMGQPEQDPDLPRLASNVLGKVQYNLCVAGQVDVAAGQVNFEVSRSQLGAAFPAQRIMFCNLLYVAPCRGKNLLDNICRRHGRQNYWKLFFKYFANVCSIPKWFSISITDQEERVNPFASEDFEHNSSNRIIHEQKLNWDCEMQHE